MPKCLVLFYEKEDGSSPAEEYINSLDVKMSAKAYRMIGLLSANGSDLREPYSRYLDDGIFELRPRVGSDIARVLYFFMVGSRAVLTHGFTKKGQKAPKSEIDRAKAYRKDYLSREVGNDENL